MKRLPAEWEEQRCLIFVLPHIKSDWKEYLDEITTSYVSFIKAVSKFQQCLVVSDDKKRAENLLKGKNINIVKIQTNDTWVRDFGSIDFFENSILKSYDFNFNAWGGKFDWQLDNDFNKNLKINNLIQKDFILEGGSIDSNGDGVLLTTETCLLNENRNATLNKEQISNKLKELFGLREIIWLKYGKIIGDDTDSHVDTLARFIKKDTIAYVKCYDKEDEHFEELSKMEEELMKTNFKLVALPLPKPVFYKDKRLSATYANFVFVNKALIVPTYQQDYDKIAIDTLKNELPNLEIIGVDSRVFLRQNGSLHCASMNKFKG